MWTTMFSSQDWSSGLASQAQISSGLDLTFRGVFGSELIILPSPLLTTPRGCHKAPFSNFFFLVLFLLLGATFQKHNLSFHLYADIYKYSLHSSIRAHALSSLSQTPVLTSGNGWLQTVLNFNEKKTKVTWSQEHQQPALLGEACHH